MVITILQVWFRELKKMPVINPKLVKMEPEFKWDLSDCKVHAVAGSPTCSSKKGLDKGVFF